MLSVVLLRSIVAVWACSPDVLPPAYCAEPEEGKVSVTVVSILASTKDDKIDEKLNDIAREVRKKMPELTGFRLATTTCRNVTLGNKEKFPAIDNQEVSVEAKNSTDKAGRFSLQVKAPPLSSLTYTCAGSKYFPIVTGYETKDGERLIVAVMVETPKSK
jgi:hypothetical protein